MIDITDTAAERVKQAIQRRGRGVGIKIGVRTTGCSGLAYTLEFVDSAPDTQQGVEHHDIKGVGVFVNTEHCVYLQGMTIDYQRRGLNEGFEFINPNEKDRCGCGESFRV
jgi:iron-sulfur cluster assembly protein